MIGPGPGRLLCQHEKPAAAFHLPQIACRVFSFSLGRRSVGRVGRAAGAGLQVLSARWPPWGGSRGGGGDVGGCQAGWGRGAGGLPGIRSGDGHRASSIHPSLSTPHPSLSQHPPSIPLSASSIHPSLSTLHPSLSQPPPSIPLSAPSIHPPLSTPHTPGRGGLWGLSAPPIPHTHRRRL
jgi:hypothetical protein